MEYEGTSHFQATASSAKIELLYQGWRAVWSLAGADTTAELQWWQESIDLGKAKVRLIWFWWCIPAG